MEVIRTDKEVDDLLNRVQEGADKGTKYPGMSYEEGVLAFAEYLEGRAEADEIYEP
jgi:hypothetical protein